MHISALSRRTCVHNLHMSFLSAQPCALSFADPNHAFRSAFSKYYLCQAQRSRLHHNLNANRVRMFTFLAASGVWRSCGCCGCTEGQNGAAQGHQEQCDDVPHGRQDCDPAVGVRSKPLLCRQERSVLFPQSVSQYPQSVSQCPRSVSQYPQPVSQYSQCVSQYPQAVMPSSLVALLGVMTTSNYSWERLNTP